MKSLQDELVTARAHEQAEGFMVNYTAILSAKQNLADAQNAVEKVSHLNPESLTLIESLDSEIFHLSNKLAAHSLTYSIESQSNKTALVANANEPPKSIEFDDNPLIGTASGRVRIETADVIITVESGEGDIQTQWQLG